MSHSFFAASRPMAIAHRGGGGLAPENTTAAFDNAMALGADGLELDVRLSRDGVVMVHHDGTLDRTTNRRGRLDRFTADELERADAGFHFRGMKGDRPFRGLGMGVPRLSTVLDRYRDVPIVIDMKANHRELAAAVVAAVNAADAVDRVCLGAFGWRVIHAARKLAPMIATSAAKEEVRWALYRSWLHWPVQRVAYAVYQVPEMVGATRIVSPRFVDEAHRAGLPVQVWTIDTEDEARRLLGWNVNALITDRPDIIVPIVRNRLASGVTVDRS